VRGDAGHLIILHVSLYMLQCGVPDRCGGCGGWADAGHLLVVTTCLF